MSLTHAQLHAIVEELDALTVPSGVQKVFERDPDAFVLQLRGRGETRYLLVDTTPGGARIHLVSGKPTQPDHPSAFVMSLRKHLVGTGLQRIELAPRDRMVTLHLLRRTDTTEFEVELVLELFGRRPTAVLIVDGKVAGLQHSHGRLRLGAAYEPPPAAPSEGSDDSDPLGLAALPIGERSTHAEAHLDEASEREAVSGQRRALSAALKSESKRARRLVKNLEGDLQRAEAAQDFRRRGELLQSAYALELPRGATSARVPDYYEPGSPEVEIALDPARSLKENIARYFHEYRRMKGAIDSITERLIAAMDQAAALDAAREELLETADEGVEELEARLRADGVLASRQRPQQQRRARRGPPPPYRTFVGRSGAKILVGRGAKHNDALTTKVARGRDVWMHARDWAGAHVVIRMDKDGEPHGEDLRDAALLAVHFSKGRGDSLVDVTHTRAKWVRKPKGAPPGLVTVAGGSTIAVAPDEERLTELFAAEQTDD